MLRLITAFSHLLVLDGMVPRRDGKLLPINIEWREPCSKGKKNNGTENTASPAHEAEPSRR